MQEDIIGITDSNNNLLCSYLYDSWGNIISIKDNNGNIIRDTSHIGIINPYRYRSYYYDNETKKVDLMNNYNNIDYIKKNIKDGCCIHFEYKNSICDVFYDLPKNIKDTYLVYFSCNTMYYEMDAQNFNTIEEFFEEGTVEGELIKNIWNRVRITGTTGF